MMNFKQGDFAIYNNKHLVLIEHIHATMRRSRASIKYTRNDNVTITEWVSASKLEPIPDDIKALPENTQLKIRAMTQSVATNTKPLPDIHPTLAIIRKIDVNSLSPIEALTKLYELKRMAQS